MDHSHPLYELFQSIYDLRIAGSLYYPNRSTDFDSAANKYAPSYNYKVLQNKTLLGVSEYEYRGKLKELLKVGIDLMQKAIDENKPKDQVLHLYHEALVELNNVCDFVKGAPKTGIDFLNKHDRLVFPNDIADLGNLQNFELFEFEAEEYFKEFRFIRENIIDKLNQVLNFGLERVRSMNFLDPIVPTNKNGSKGLSSTDRSRGEAINDTIYLISSEIITKFYDRFQGEIFEPIPLHDFLKCFDVNNMPDKQLRYLYTRGMVYALSFTKVSEKMALSHFALKSYRHVKSNYNMRDVTKNRRQLHKDIEAIFKPKPIPTTSR